MGVNFSPIEIGRRALRASQLGLTVAGQNIANVNTPGYTRQGLQLSATPSLGADLKLSSIGTGVTIDGIRSFRERFVESRLQTETAIAGRFTGLRDALAPVDAAFNNTNEGGGIGASLSGFFNAFGDLEANPISTSARYLIVVGGGTLGEAFRSTRERLIEIRRDADTTLLATAEQVNGLSEDVARLNLEIITAENAGDNASELRDQRGEAVRQLAELVGARSVENPDGTATLTLGDGRALVLSDRAFRLEAVATPPEGLTALRLEGTPAVINDGRVRGLQDAMRQIAAQVQAVDDFAASIADQVNTRHTAGIDLDGNPGQAFFVSTDGGPITAANLDVAPGIKADARRVVASASGQGTGDGSVARNIASLLAEQTSTAGAKTGTFAAINSSIVADAGAGVKAADDALATQQPILAQVIAQRDAASGVSLDEEAINLLQYQKAYEAAARFLQIADELTRTIIALGQ